MRLKDKVAIITGAGRGIGQATAVKFAREGAKVVVCDLSEAAIAETLKLCGEAGAQTLGCVANVTDNSTLKAMVQATLAKFGRIDCLVNNAGIVADAQMKNMTEDQFDKVIAVNLKGVWLCLKHEIAHMRAHGGGAIVMTRADRAKSLRKPPVYVLGCGQSITHASITSMPTRIMPRSRSAGPMVSTISFSRGDNSVSFGVPPRTMLERRSSGAGTRFTAPAYSPSTRRMRLSPRFTSGRNFWITHGSRNVTANMS